MEEIVNLLLKEYEKGNIVYRDIQGVKSISIENFIKQPLDGILYDLNRLEEVILTHAPTDEKWINDFALVKLLKYYYEENKRLRNESSNTII